MPAGTDRLGRHASRRAAVVIALLLLAATAAAFAYTERQKLGRGTVSKPRATHYLSPGCDCPKATAFISFRLASPQTITVRIVRESGRLVRTLVERERHGAGTVRLEWDGRGRSGDIVSDGRYLVAVHTGNEDTTVVFPQAIVVDTEPPSATITRVRPSSAPAGEPMVVTYELSEPGRAILYVDGVQVDVGDRGRKGKIEWDGTIDGAPAEPGGHEITLVGLDLAENASPRAGPVAVEILP